MNRNRSSTLFLTRAGIIAAFYAVLTVALAPISYGPLQFRVSEVLTVLPVFSVAAVPGLTVGCVIANAAGVLMGVNFGPVDILIGSGATLIAALGSYAFKKVRWFGVPWLSLLCPVIANGLIVGTELWYFTQAPFIASVGYVALGEAVVCLVGGTILFMVIEKSRLKSLLK